MKSRPHPTNPHGVLVKCAACPRELHIPKSEAAELRGPITCSSECMQAALPCQGSNEGRIVNLEGKRVVVTGKIGGESRNTAEQKLREAGALVQSAVGKDTDLLVTGEAVGAKKLEKAAALGVEVMPWDAVWSNGGRARAAVAAPTRRASARQIAPMLCTKTDELPVGDDWLFEFKWDGVRCVATVSGGAVSMRSRSDKTEYADRYPKIAAELARFPDCVIDGEIVVLDKNGGSSFQNLVSGGAGQAAYVVYDLLEANGDDFQKNTLESRQLDLVELLAGVEGKLRLISVSPVFDDGPALLKVVQAQQLEGIVAKKRHSVYEEGRRGPTWLKYKVRPSQEFLVLGWCPGEGQFSDTMGALVLGVYEGNKLVFCGKVGTGFDVRERYRLGAALEKIPAAKGEAIQMPDKARRGLDRDGVEWVKPTMVVQVEFQRWTDDGVLWHPSYQGERTDKKPKEVVRER